MDFPQKQMAKESIGISISKDCAHISLLTVIRDTEGYLVLRRQTCVFLAPSHSSSEPTVANRMYLPSELCAITLTQCPEVLLAPTNASAAPSRRAERDTEDYAPQLGKILCTLFPSA